MNLKTCIFFHVSHSFFMKNTGKNKRKQNKKLNESGPKILHLNASRQCFSFYNKCVAFLFE